VLNQLWTYGINKGWLFANFLNVVLIYRIYIGISLGVILMYVKFWLQFHIRSSNVTGNDDYQWSGSICKFFKWMTMSSRYFEMKTVDNQSETSILFLNVTNCSHPALLDIVTTSRMLTNTCEWLTILQNSKTKEWLIVVITILFCNHWQSCYENPKSWHFSHWVEEAD